MSLCQNWPTLNESFAFGSRKLFIQDFARTASRRHHISAISTRGLGDDIGGLFNSKDVGRKP